MADNVLESGPPSAKRPKLASPALSVSTSDGNDFGSFFDLEHDLPDELISSSDPGLTNGGDPSPFHSSFGGGVQDAAAKHKQLSELLRAGAPAQPGPPASNSAPSGPSMAMMGGVCGPQGMHHQGQQQQQQPGLMQQVGMAPNRATAMMAAQKSTTGQQQHQHQGLIGGQVVNGSPRMGYPGNTGMGSNSNILAETLQQQQGGPGMAAGGQAGMRPLQPGALKQMNLMGNAGSYGGPYSHSAGQGLPGEGLAPQLQNKTGLPNSMAAQFNMDKKTPPGQGIPGMAARRYCPHHVGHYLGMDVHDTPELSRSQPLQPGMVITIEPGLYIGEDNDQAPEHFRGLGVRIEDDVVIREKGGPLILSCAAPKTIADVERTCEMG